MADTRFEPRLRTCPWCGDEVLVETVPGHEERSRMWVPGTDYIHAHTLEQVVAYGNYVRAQQLAQEAPAQPRRPAPTPPPPPPTDLEYGNETI